MLYFTPGPSQLYPTTKKHIIHALHHDLGSLSHRSIRFQEIYSDTVLSLRKLMAIPLSHQIFFLPSSLESMERIIQNIVETYSFHFINGAFSQKWYEFALQLGKKPYNITADYGNGFSFKNTIIPASSELICITQNETSTGVMIPMKEIYGLKKRFPHIPIALDIVSSAPYPPIDFSKIDMAFFSVQKGFGIPAGLSVLIVNKNILDRSHGTFHSFKELSQMADKHQTPETPNVIFIYALGKICQDMLKKGIKTIRKETDQKAKLLYDFAENNHQFKPFVKDNIFRSLTTIELALTEITSEKIIGALKKKGIVVGKGYGKFKDAHIRIANFPAHSVNDMKQLIKNMTTYR